VKGIEYLDIEDALRLVRRLGVGPVRDLGLLDSALARPRAFVLGADAYPTIALKAAALLTSVAGNHALVDGNKRLGWLATLVFLDLNGSAVDVVDEAVVDLVIDVAAGATDVEQAAEWVSALAYPTPRR
jgi:death-on-curing protein